MNIPVLPLIFALLPISLVAQAVDTVAGHRSVSEHIEVRFVNNKSVLEIEGGYHMSRYLSADLIVTAAVGGVRAGISVYPVPFLSVQSSIGITEFNDRPLDGPQFDPDYIYTLTGGVRIPIGSLPAAFSIAFGRQWMVQNNYSPGGGFIIGDVAPVNHRKEIRHSALTSVGVTLLL